MGTTLTGKRVQNTYDSLLKLSDNDNLTGTAKIVGDGLGNDSPIYLSTSKIGIGVSPTYQFQTSGDGKFGGSLIIAGDLTVNGTTTIVDSTIVAIGDNMIEMAKDNTANTMDIGWYGTIVESGTKYVGTYYDAGSGVTTPTFYIGLGTTEPSSTAAWTTKGKLVIGQLDATGATITGNLSVTGTIADSDGDVGTSGQILSSTGSGTDWIDLASDTAERIEITVKNVSGASLSKGTVIHASPTASPPSGNVIEVIAADYDDTSKMPAIGVLNETITNEAEGAAVMIGAVSGIDTSAFNIGDEIYVGNNGGFTNTKPTATTQLIQKMAVVIKSHASNGLIKVFGAGRSNDVPNEVDRDLSIAGDLTVNDTINVESSTGYGNIEIGGPSGGYIDLKAPFSDDYDIRIITSSGGNEITTASGDLKINVGNTLALTLDGSTQNATFAADIFSDGLYVNATSAVSGTQVAIVKDGEQNLQRWGTSADGSSQDSYRFRIDQNMKFIGNSGSADTITIESSTGNIDTSGRITAIESTFTRDSGGYSLRLDSANSSTDNDLRFAKGGTDYAAIQNGSTHNFEFYVNSDGTNSGWIQSFYSERANGNVNFNYAINSIGNSGGMYFYNTGSGHGVIETMSGKDLNIVSGSGDVYVKDNLHLDTGSASTMLKFHDDAATRKISLFQGADNDYQFYGFGVEAATLVYSTYTTSDDHVFFAGTSSTTRNELAKIKGDGTIRLSQYGSGSFTGTSAYNLAVDSSGNIIETDGDVIDGSGTANYVAKWIDSNTLGNTIIYEDGSKVGINVTPTGILDVKAANAYSRFFSYNASAYTFVSIGRTASELEIGVAAATNQFFTGASAGDGIIKVPSGKLHLGYSSGSPAMTIDTSNRVGIGTLSPEEKLVVVGNIGFGAGGYNGGVYANNTTGDVDENWGFEIQRTSGVDDYNTRLKYYPVNGTSRKAGIWSSRDNNFTIYSNDDTVPNIIIPNGSLGIGETDPTSKLHVKDTPVATSGAILTLRNSQATASNTTFGGVFFNSAPGYDFSIGKSNVNAASTLSFRNGNSGASLMDIDPSGNVGISNNSPATKLDVAGTIRAANITSPTSGAGTELLYNPSVDTGYVLAYDRGNSVYKNMQVVGSTIILESSGTVMGKFNGTFSYLTNSNSGNYEFGNQGGRTLTSNGTGWSHDGKDAILTLSSSGNSNSTNIANSIGLNLYHNSNTDNTYSPAITFSNLSNSGSYNTAYAVIIGKKTGQGVDSNWSAGELHFFTGKVSAYMQSTPDMMIASSGSVGIGKTPDSNYALDINEKLRITAGMVMIATTSNLYATNGALSYYSASNGVYLNGAGTSGWLRLQSAGTTNNQYAINIMGANAGGYIDFRTANVERMKIMPTGYIGINQSNPSSILELRGYADSYANGLRWSHRSTSNYYEYVHGTNSRLYFGYTGTTKHYFDGPSGGGIVFTPTSAPGGSGDYSNATNFPYKIDTQSTNASYWRIPHLSANASVAGVYNYESGKNVYWGEPSDVGLYYFRGRSIYVQAATPTLTLETTGNANDPVITLKSSGAITGEGAQIYYDNSVGTLHLTTTYVDATADIVFHTATGTDQATGNVRMRVKGNGDITFADTLSAKANRINSGYSTAANDSDIWINYEGYLNGNSYYRDFRVGDGRNSQIAIFDGSTSRVGIMDSSKLPDAKFEVFYDGGNGGGSYNHYGILTEASGAYQATLGAHNTGDGYANLNLSSDVSGQKLWHLSKRPSSLGHRFEWFYYAAGFTSRFCFFTNGDFHADGDIVAYSTTISDASLKDNVVTIDNALDKVKQLRGVSYKWNSGPRNQQKDLGVIAQEVEKVFPEIVYEKQALYHGDKQVKSVDYEKLTAVLIESVKELSAKVEALENKKCNCNCK